MYPRNYWYVAAMSHEVGRALLPRTLMGEPVLLFRREDGSVAAVADRCSHRRVSLSLGRLVGDEVQCGYHGLRFDGDGRCVHIPNQERIPAKACIRAYPVAESDGFVWFWPGQPALAEPAQVPDFGEVCSSGRYAGRPAQALHVAAPCLFNIENVLDLSHVTYAHEHTVGTPEVAETTPDVTVTDEFVEVRRAWHDTPASPVFRRLFGWERMKRTQNIRFWPGGNVRLNITMEPPANGDPAQVRNIRVVGPCTPETDATHYKFSAMYRDFARDDEEVSRVIAEQFQITILEDKVLMENQHRNWQTDGTSLQMPPGTSPLVDIAVDRAPIAARRLLHRQALAERLSH